MKILFQKIFTLLLFSTSRCVYADISPRGAIVTSDGYTIAQNNEEGKRVYLYGTSLEPVLGFVLPNARVKMGFEKFIYPLTSKSIKIHLNINFSLQQKIETQLDIHKEELEADEVLAAVMDSGSGKILSMATSNRYDPNNITKKDIPSLYSKMIKYPYEPGSVLKPLSLAIALEHKSVTPQTWINTHNGELKVTESRTIKDNEKFSSMTATDIIVRSSNIGIAEIAWKLTGKEFHKGLTSFGIAKLSGIELLKSNVGILKNADILENRLQRASTSYGYGMLVTFAQLFKAYSAFNNDGITITPHLIDYIEDEKGIWQQKIESQYSVSKKVANEIRQILKEVVQRGTGMYAGYKGLEIGGKTGTAYISKNGHYVREFHSSFYGFANDSVGHKYTIGVLVIRAKAPNAYFASQSAVSVFREIVETMVNAEYLIPNQEKRK